MNASWKISILDLFDAFSFTYVNDDVKLGTKISNNSMLFKISIWDNRKCAFATHWFDWKCISNECVVCKEKCWINWTQDTHLIPIWYTFSIKWMSSIYAFSIMSNWDFNTHLEIRIRIATHVDNLRVQSWITSWIQCA